MKSLDYFSFGLPGWMWSEDLRWALLPLPAPQGQTLGVHYAAHFHLAQKNGLMGHLCCRNLLRPSVPTLNVWVTLFSDHVHSMAFHICPERKTLTSPLNTLYLNFCNIPFIWVWMLQTTFLLTLNLGLSLFSLHAFTLSLLSEVQKTVIVQDFFCT